MCVISTLSFAQKGEFAVEGAFSFSTSKVTPDGGSSSKNTDVSLLPGFSYFIANNTAVGANIGFEYSKNGSTDAKTSLFVFQPFVRYYYALGEKFTYAPEVYIGVGLGTYKVGNISNDITAWQIGTKIVRFEYAIAPKIKLSFSAGTIGYEYAKVDNVGKTNNFNAGINIEPTLGFSYTF